MKDEIKNNALEIDLESEVDDAEELETDDTDNVDEKDKDSESDESWFVKQYNKIVKKNKGEDDSDETGKDIPEEFIEAALGDGWSKEKISKYATDKTDEELLETALEINSKDSEEDVDDEKSDDGQDGEPREKEDDNKEDSIEGIPPEILEKIEKRVAEGLEKAITEKFEKKYSGLQEKLNQQKEDKKIQLLNDLENQANIIFDDANEEFKVFGKTDKLPRFPGGKREGQLITSSPQFKARNKVYTRALVFLDSGLADNMKEAMKDAIYWYKGKNLEKDVETKVIRKLKRNEKKLSAKRTAKETVKKYESEDDEGADLVRQSAKELGIRLSKN